MTRLHSLRPGRLEAGESVRRMTRGLVRPWLCSVPHRVLNIACRTSRDRNAAVKRATHDTQARTPQYERGSLSGADTRPAQPDEFVRPPLP